MRAIRTAVIVSALVGSLAAAPAALAAGKAPAGGVFPLTGQDDIVVTNIVCDDATITEVHVARGGITAWVLGAPDRMYVLTSLAVVSDDGSFTQHYGQKRGLKTVVECTMDYTILAPGWEQSGVMTATMGRVW
jgi:hypothetical protein